MSLIRRAVSMLSARQGAATRTPPARRGVGRRKAPVAPASPASRILGMLRRR